MSQTTEKRSRFARFGRWVAELVLVFVGVSAAFWLSNYQQHRQDAERRDQILASIEQTLRQGIESSKVNRVTEQEPAAAEFRRALDAGEMPPQLSDELIVPNLDQDISFFYDPTTKKLRKRFEIYPEALQETVNFANELERTHTELLKRIQAERQQNR